MTPGARLSAAISVLDAWSEGLSAEQALSRWSRGARYAGSKDRAAVRDLVFDVLRRKENAARAGGGRTARALVLGLVRLTGEDPSDLFTGEGHAPAPLSKDERSGSAGALAVCPELDIPEWLRAGIARRASGEGARGELFARLGQRAPVWLRVALRRGGREAAQAGLSAEGIETRAEGDCATALRVVSGARALRRSGAYLSGLVELQDLSAQRAVARVPWPADGRILDFCAGGGGKSLAIADQSGAAIFAHDVSERRMTDLPARAARAGVRIERIAPGGAASYAPFDAVLCDVPCSGSGIWRRDPEAKWRLTPDRLGELCRTQAAILDEAADLVTGEGLLVYMTCSLLADENERQVEDFLARRSRWRLEDLDVATPLTASDGFFTAVLRRGA